MDKDFNKNIYDVVIVGSGFAGMLCAVILGKQGYKVLVLEKNQHLGGTIQSFTHNGRHFSTGLHYIGSLDRGQVMHKIFKYAGLLDGIRYQRMDEQSFEVFKINGCEYAIPLGWENYRQKLISYFPDEKEAIDRYIHEVNKVADTQEIYNLMMPLSGLAEKPSQSVNAWEFICSLTNNADLRQVLSALNFVYAGEKEVTPWYVHALINHYFINSSYRVIGPSQQIPERLKQVIEGQGGKVLANHQVSRFLFKEEKLTGVVCSNEKVFEAQYFISNMHPITTMQLIEPGKIKKNYRHRLEQKKDTISSFAVFLSIKPGIISYRNHNFNYFKQPDVWYAGDYCEDTWPQHFFMHFPAGESKTVDHVSVVTYMKFDEVMNWAHLPVGKRGADYKAFKERKARQLLALVIEQFPEFEEAIEGYTVATPLTYRDYIGSPTGSMYGTLRDYRNALSSYIGARTKIPNLYLTGQNLNLHGLMGVSMSTLLTCSEFVDLQTLLNEINDQ